MTPPSSPSAILRGDAASVADAALALLADAEAGTAGLLAALVDPPALVLGSAQRADTVDAPACERAGLVAVRRGSGGGAVLCDAGLLEVDVALPAGHRLHEADVGRSYAWLGAAWREALAGVGVETRVLGEREARGAAADRRAAARAACWAGLSPGEVVLPDGRKLVGLSQRRRGGATLFQCGIACTGSPARVLSYLRLDARERAVAAAALRQTAALDELAGPIAPATVWRAVGPVLAQAVSSCGAPAAKVSAGR